MSSLAAHGAMGWLAAGKGDRPILIRLAFAAAAVVPDVDYPLEWIFGIRLHVRYTHSLAFCALVALVGIAVTRGRTGMPDRSLWRWVAASFSHLALDALVGVYPEPWLWPFSEVTYRLPFGILPSAGRLAWGNVYLYRNLAIEAGILLPATWLLGLWGALPGKDSRDLRALGPRTALAAIVLAGFGLWGWSLDR